MTTKNLWGELPEADSVRTPVGILREQASLLTEMTRGVLQGMVSVEHRGDGFRLVMSVVAPALNHYRYSVLVAEHPLSLYPLTVGNVVGEVACADEASFVAAIEKVLTSPETRRVIQALLAQSNAA